MVYFSLIMLLRLILRKIYSAENLVCLKVQDPPFPPLSTFLAAGESYLRRSGTDIIPKARMKTLKMTVVIVLSFVVCWTPYYLLGLWYWFQPDVVRLTPEYVHHALFVFGNLNTCCDPVIYGFYTPSFRADLASCCRRRRRSQGGGGANGGAAGTTAAAATATLPSSPERASAGGEPQSDRSQNEQAAGKQ